MYVIVTSHAVQMKAGVKFVCNAPFAVVLYYMVLSHVLKKYTFWLIQTVVNRDGSHERAYQMFLKIYTKGSQCWNMC